MSRIEPKKIVAILDQAEDGSLSAYVGHTHKVEQFRRMNLLAARSCLTGNPRYDAQSYPAAGWLAGVLAANREPRFVVLEEAANARRAELRRIAWIHVLDRAGVRVPVQEDSFLAGMAETLQDKLAQQGITKGLRPVMGEDQRPAASGTPRLRDDPESRSLVENLRRALGRHDAPEPTWETKSPWNDGPIRFQTMDGVGFPYRPQSSRQSAWIDLVSGPPGYGKSILVNALAMGFLTSQWRENGNQLPRLSILDRGSSAQGVASFLRASLPPGKRHQVAYIRLKLALEHAVNPFDTPIGLRYPLPQQKFWLANFLKVMVTPVGATEPDQGMTYLIGAVIDEVYAYRSDMSLIDFYRWEEPGQATRHWGCPNLYAVGEAPAVDDALSQCAMTLSSSPTWWEVTDVLAKAGKRAASEIAQSRAVPTLADLIDTVRTCHIMDVFKNMVTATGEPLVDVFVRQVSAVLRYYPSLVCPTRFRFDREMRVRVLDLDEACRTPGDIGVCQSHLFWMLGRKLLADDLLPDVPVNVGSSNHPYLRPMLAQRQSHRELHEGQIIYEEMHNFMGARSIVDQVENDAREATKWGVGLCVASQRASDFTKVLADLATGTWILGAASKKAAIEIARTFKLPDGAVKTIEKHLVGPSADGMVFLASILTKTGRSDHLLRYKPEPEDIWAITGNTQDAVLRERLVHKVGPDQAVRLLSDRFPSGSAYGEINQRIWAMSDTGDDQENLTERIIDAIAVEVIS